MINIYEETLVVHYKLSIVSNCPVPVAISLPIKKLRTSKKYVFDFIEVLNWLFPNQWILMILLFSLSARVLLLVFG